MGYYYKNQYYKTKEAAEKAKAKAEGKTYTPSTSTPKTTTSSGSGSYNETWEANGRTYVGGVDVGPAGTRVDTSNTTSMTNQAIRDNNSGSSSYTPSYQQENTYDRYQQEYDDLLSEYQAQQEYIREQQRKANEAAVNSGVQRLQNQLTASNQAFDQAGRDAYINAMRNQYTLPNQLNAMGYTGGLSETEAARSRANYANTLADIEQQRALTTNETNLAINDLRNQADQRTAEQNAALAQDYIDKIALLKEQSKANELTDWKNTAQYLYGDDYTAEIQRLAADNADGKNSQKIAYLTALRQEKLNNMAEAEDEEWQRKYKEAQLMADLGDYSGLRALGYNPSEETSTGSGGGSGNGSTGEGKVSDNYSDVLDYTKAYAYGENGNNYASNMKAAKYVIGELDVGNITRTELINILRQSNITPETVARTLSKTYGATRDEISKFIIDYFGGEDKIDDEYLQKILEFSEN